MNGEYSNLIDKNTGFNKYVFLWIDVRLLSIYFLHKWV